MNGGWGNFNPRDKKLTKAKNNYSCGKSYCLYSVQCTGGRPSVGEGLGVEVVGLAHEVVGDGAVQVQSSPRCLRTQLLVRHEAQRFLARTQVIETQLQRTIAANTRAESRGRECEEQHTTKSS